MTRPPPHLRRRLTVACHVAGAVILLSPMAVAVLVKDKTHAAVAAVMAVITFRFVSGDLVAWLEEAGG